MTAFKTLALCSVCAAVPLFSAPQVMAQSIEVGQLGAAQAYDAGVIDFQSGGLDPALWQGTSAEMATSLLSRLPSSPQNPVVRDMIRAVVLSAGVPPEGTDAGYSQARLRSVMALNDPQALQNLAARSPDVVADPAVRADLALALGEIEKACTMADSVSEGRGTPIWARLRAVCHVKRGEIPAAELTANLLKNSGYKDATFFKLLGRLTGVSSAGDSLDVSGDPLYAAMAGLISQNSPAPLASSSLMTPLQAVSIAKDPKASTDARLAAVFKAGRLLDDAAVGQILNGMIFDGVAVEDLDAASNFDLNTALSSRSGKSFAQLFALTRQGGDPANTAKAAAELLSRAQKAGAFERFADVLESEISVMPAEVKAQENLKLFAKAAILRGDIGALQSLHGALAETPKQQSRIALAADALGNGFRFGDLGRDIEARLNEPASKTRAARDAYIALALGSTLSDAGAKALEGAGSGTGRSLAYGDIAALKAAAKSSARAQTALRSVLALEGRGLDGRSMAAVIEALMEAQLSEYAGKLAALDYIDAL